MGAGAGVDLEHPDGGCGHHPIRIILVGQPQTAHDMDRAQAGAIQQDLDGRAVRVRIRPVGALVQEDRKRVRPARRHVQRKVGVRRAGQETDVRTPVTNLEPEEYADWVELYDGSAVAVALGRITGNNCHSVSLSGFLSSLVFGQGEQANRNRYITEPGLSNSAGASAARPTVTVRFRSAATAH